MIAVDLFAGAGGFSLGLRRAGFNVVLANEYSVDPEWTYRHNLLAGTDEGQLPDRPNDLTAWGRRLHRLDVRAQILAEREDFADDYTRHMRGGDIRRVMPNEWLASWRRRFRQEVDLLVAGPPCQGFSVAGRLVETDERNQLVGEALRVILTLQPRVAVIENVPGMLDRYWSVPHFIGQSLSKPGKGTPGYYVWTDLVHGEPLGVPQTRKRLLIMAVRRDVVHPSAYERLPRLLFPVACPVSRPVNHTLTGGPVRPGATLTSRRILGDLLNCPPEYGKGESWLLPYRRGARMQGDDFLREVRAIREVYLDGGTVATAEAANRAYANHESSSHLPDVSQRMRLLRAAALSSEETHAYRCCSGWLREQVRRENPALITRKQAQRVLLPDEWPMLTVTSLPDDIVHFEEDRIPTVREMARLQTFPDWFEFKGVRTTCSHRRREGEFVPQFTQVANAVPPRLGHAVAARIRQFLLLAQRDSSCSFTIDAGDHEFEGEGPSAQRLAALNAAFREANPPSRRVVARVAS